jgi:RNA polymerase sigma factor (sigma-70 family)
MANSRVRAVGADEPEQTIADLFRQWREPMARLAYVLTSDSSRSDEIVQDAFLKLHANWSRVDNPVGYLRTAVVNGCRSHHRHLAVVRRAPVGRESVADLATNELGDAVAKLDYPYRAALALRYFCDLADDEIAHALGVRPATVRTRIRRALIKLRTEIER